MLKPDLSIVKEYFKSLQNSICHTLEQTDRKEAFQIDNWNNANVIEASTRVLANGNIIEQAAVNFSHVRGNKLPPSACVRYPELTGASFDAVGVSLIIHPHNPYIPTTHANIRFFVAQPENSEPVWWFGGGYDLTPFYPFDEDCQHWHKTAYNACESFGEDVYHKFKKWCDEYFFLAHRNETRGVGGLFFDDLNEWPFERCFEFAQAIGNSFIPAYVPIVNKRKDTLYGERERDFQLYRRGRYVEFNLLQDRGTLFGIQSKGRTESILVSMPPLVKWRYNWHPEPGTPEARLYSDYLKARNWVICKTEYYST